MTEQMQFAKMSDVFKQLSDASRLSVLNALWGSPLSVRDICKKTSLSQPNASHHLAQLRSQGLVKSVRKGQSAFYSIADKHVYTMIEECMEHVEQHR